MSSVSTELPLELDSSLVASLSLSSDIKAELSVLEDADSLSLSDVSHSLSSEDESTHGGGPSSPSSLERLGQAGTATYIRLPLAVTVGTANAAVHCLRSVLLFLVLMYGTSSITSIMMLFPSGFLK